MSSTQGMTNHDPDCSACRAAGGGLLCTAQGPIGERLKLSRSVVHVRRGGAIFHEDADPTSLFVVANGLVKVSSLSRGGGELVLRVLGAGEVLGYRSLLAEEPYAAGAEALADTVLCSFPAPVVRHTLRELPELAFGLLIKLARELRRSEHLMMNLLHRKAPQRVARLLMELPEWVEGEPYASALWSHGLAHRSMAAIIGVTPETFSRVLKGLKRRKIIETSGRRIVIRNAAALERAAGIDRKPPGDRPGPA